MAFEIRGFRRTFLYFVIEFVVLGIGILMIFTFLTNDSLWAQEVSGRQTTVDLQMNATLNGFDISNHSTSRPESIWVIVNKQRPLNPIDYVPQKLVIVGEATISSEAESDYRNMLDAALSDGVTLRVNSSYRSYDLQTNLYNSYVATYGQTAADTFSARPGYSEHQTGFAIDFGSVTNSKCELEDCFATTAEGAWLAANSYKYGFILRYPSGKQTITGYKYEPWHFRFTGKGLAMEMRREGISTLEEFFRVDGGETYK